MRTQVDELKTLLQHKKQNINELDKQLYQQITTQNILNQLIAEDSMSQSISQLSSSSASNSDFSSSQSIASSQLMAQVESVNNFMINCVRDRPWSSRPTRQFQTSAKQQYHQPQEQPMIEVYPPQASITKNRESYLKNYQKGQQKQSPVYEQSTIRKQIPPYSPHMQTMSMGMTIRQEQIRRQRQAIRNAIIKQQQKQDKQSIDSNLNTTKKPFQLSYDRLQPDTINGPFDLQAFKRKNALQRSIKQIRKAKQGGDRLQQSITNRLTYLRM